MKIVLVDGYSLIYRAFHALPLMDNGAGEYTNAVYGFMSMLLKVIAEEKPTHCAVAFDMHAKTFRHEHADTYKAGRAPTPEEMRPQVPVIREMLEKMHIPILETEKYEADDILGTVSACCEAAGEDALIVTGDRDSFQLAGPHTTILYTKRGITDTEHVTPEWIAEKYGVTPAQMIDVKGLMGDSSDNIPGVPGVGEKTALKLIQEFGTLENVLDTAAEQQKGKLRERLLAYADQARDSKYLATIVRDAPVALDMDAAQLHSFADARPVMERLKLKSLLARMSVTPAKAASAALTDVISWQAVEELSGAAELAARLAKISPDAEVAFDFGRQFSLAATDGTRLSVALEGDLISGSVDETEIIAALMPILHRPCAKVVSDAKRIYRDCPDVAGTLFDVRLAAYAVNAQRKSYAMADLCGEEAVPLEEAAPAASLFLLRERLRGAIATDDLTHIYDEIELPLARVLADMEKTGFTVDADALAVLGSEYRACTQALTEEIYRLAGEAFNINSPKQLGEVLFEKLRIPGGKKTKTGWTTNAETLEYLAADYPICQKVVDYRKYAKLISTYIDALIRLRGADGRVHTSFDQLATGTGRISSKEPNLQNIPVRTTLGREIRRAFVAKTGCVLVDADYSQIELRVLAHMSRDAGLIEAFNAGADIHRWAAAQIYGVAPEQVTGEMRSAAKAVNFGIVYGISDFGLARNTGSSRKEAAAFIERYFERYPGVKKYMDSVVADGKTQGYVTTMFGRRRYLPELSSANYNMRAFGERAAMNSPIQGTAADIIKISMVRTFERLRQEVPSAKIILQVHDELIIEAPEELAARVSEILVDSMENVVCLSVPLKTELSVGRNWYECK